MTEGFCCSWYVDQGFFKTLYTKAPSSQLNGRTGTKNMCMLIVLTLLSCLYSFQILCKRGEFIMSSEHGAYKRHHNPVDSICRKIKSIQMMDQVSDPTLQIPKFQSRNFDSPQCNTKKNLEEILKKRTVRSHCSTGPHLISPSSDSGSSADLQLLSPCLGRISDSFSANSSYTIVKSEERSSNSWMPVCPMETCSSSYFRTGEATTQNKLCALSNTESKDALREQNYLTSSPNLYFFTSDKKPESAVIQSPVLKRLPLRERGKNPGEKTLPI